MSMLTFTINFSLNKLKQANAYMCLPLKPKCRVRWFVDDHGNIHLYKVHTRSNENKYQILNNANKYARNI